MPNSVPIVLHNAPLCCAAWAAKVGLETEADPRIMANEKSPSYGSNSRYSPGSMLKPVIAKGAW
jgi:hypothetical protein